MRIERIGGATLYLGDCLQVIPTLPQVGAVVTDPPYGIAWKRGDNVRQRGSKRHAGILNDDSTATRDAALALLGDVPGIVFGSFYAPYPDRLKQVAVWHKPPDSGLVGSVTGLRRDAEPIFLTGEWPVRTVTHSSVIHTPQGQAATVTATGHPHTKPVSLMEFLVRLTHAETVLDPFMGSGSTGVACANSGRKFIGVELDPAYFQTACDRIEAAYAQGRLFA